MEHMRLRHPAPIFLLYYLFSRINTKKYLDAQLGS